MICKYGFGRDRSKLLQGTILAFAMGPYENTKNLSQGSSSSGRQSNPRAPEYEAGMLTIRLRRIIVESFGQRIRSSVIFRRYIFRRRNNWFHFTIAQLAPAPRVLFISLCRGTTNFVSNNKRCDGLDSSSSLAKRNRVFKTSASCDQSGCWVLRVLQKMTLS
jgi:hypothetical protein